MLISANMISEWAAKNRRQTQDTLPELVRHMVFESDPNVRRADIPSGDSVALPGLDGVVISQNGFCPEQFLPEGESVWEFGCDKGHVPTKAESDYQKRSKDKDLIDKTTKTYIAVTPYPWKKKQAWISAKQAEGHWKDVYVLNAEDLAQWLDQCPKTRDWFASKVLGYPLTDLAVKVLPILLLTGGWDTRYEADKKVVEAISGLSHESVEANLQQFSRHSNEIGSSFFQKENSRWNLLRPELAWEFAEATITEATFSRFFQQVEVIFSELPDSYLPPSEQTILPIHHIGQGFSDTLKQGMAESLARIASTSNPLAYGYSGRAPQKLVNFHLEQIFNDDRRYNPAFWVYIASYLPTIAEAWDGGFLDCVENVLSQQPSAFTHLFQTPQYTLGSRSLSGLLFALQRLAWFPPHLSRVADILLALRPYDIRPSNEWGTISAFQELFTAWHANTAATLEEQRMILTRLMSSSPEDGWPLLMTTLPRPHTLIISRSTPRFRKLVGPINREPNPQEYYSHVAALWDLALSHAGSSAKRWGDLLEYLPEVKGSDLFKNFIQVLEKEILHLDGNTAKLWNQGIQLLAHHKQYSQTSWSFSSVEINHLEELIQRLQPSDCRELFKPLFTKDSMDLYDFAISEESSEFETIDGVIRERRKTAAQRLLTELNREEFANYILELHDISSIAVHNLSFSLADVIEVSKNADTQFLIFLLNNENNKIRWAVHSILTTISRRGEITGWADTITSELTVTGNATLWSAFPVTEEILKRVQSLGVDIETQYWKTLRPTPQDYENAGDQLIIKFLEFNLPGKALDGLGQQLYNKKPIPPSLIMDTLNIFATTTPEKDDYTFQIRPYYIEKLINYLENTDLTSTEQDRLIRLEWFLLPLLEQRTEQFSLSLFTHLADHPELFVEMLTWIYYPDKEPDHQPQKREPTEDQKALGLQAHKAIDMWDVLPGQTGSKIDENILMSWYEKGLILAKEVDREDTFNRKFGKKLGECDLIGDDGHWPCEAVRSLLEKSVTTMKKGFLLGKYNNIHGKARWVEEAKQKDALLVNSLRASSKILAPSYPKTAGILLQLAQDIEESIKLWN